MALSSSVELLYGWIASCNINTGVELNIERTWAELSTELKH